MKYAPIAQGAMMRTHRAYRPPQSIPRSRAQPTQHRYRTYPDATPLPRRRSGPAGRLAQGLQATGLPASRAEHVRGSPPPRAVALSHYAKPQVPPIGQRRPSARRGTRSVRNPLPNHHAGSVCSPTAQTPTGAHAPVVVPRSSRPPRSPRRVFPFTYFIYWLRPFLYIRGPRPFGQSRFPYPLRSQRRLLCL